MNQRRTTLGVLHEPQLSNGGRQSIAPGAFKSASQPSGRPSYAPGRASNVRPGLGMIVDGMAGLSVGAGSGLMGGRQTASLAGANRRSSSFAPRPSSAGFAQPMITKEPRPIRDKSWQANAIRTLINFLLGAGYPHPISAKTLQAPSQKDFQSIFKFLYAQLDPKYEYQKKFEEEVPVIMKGLRYPFADQISKSQLVSVGSMHAWPSLLAALTWMVELIVACDQMDGEGELDDFGGNMDAVNDPAHAEKIFFEYLSKAYAVFLAGDDNYDTMDSELISSFDRKNDLIIRQIERLTADNEAFAAELRNLNDGEDPLLTLSKERESLQHDKENFQTYKAHLENKKAKAAEAVRRVKDDVARTEQDLTQLQAEREALQVMVDAQEIRPEDADRMNAEKDQLAQQISAVQIKAEEVSKLVWDREIGVQKRMDQLEKLVQDYNTLYYRLSSMDPALTTSDIKFELEVNVHAAKAELATNVDLRGKIKPALMRLQAKYNANAHRYMDEQIALQEKLDNLSEQVSDKMEELRGIEARIKRFNDQYAEEKEAMVSENAVNASEVDRLEDEIKNLRTEATSGLLQSQQRAQKVTMEYDQSLRKSNELKEEVAKEMFRVLEDLIAFKTHVDTSLEKLAAELDNMNDVPNAAAPRTPSRRSSVCKSSSVGRV